MRALSLVVVSILLAYDSVSAQEPPNVDEVRAKRYVEAINDLVKTRVAIRKQWNAIQERDKLLVGQMQSQWFGSILKNEAALNTPQFTAMPILKSICSRKGTLGTKVGAGGLQAGGGWTTQDNSMAINFLAMSAFSDRLAAQSSYQSLQANRVVLLDIANQLNRNFSSLRARADWMGRRSRAEPQAAVAIARDSRIADPHNAGMALIEATSLRSLGEFGDADDLLNEIDDYFFQLQVIHAMMRAQFDFVNNNPDRAKKTMAEIGPIARDQAWVEPLLIRGWMAVAERDFSNGKKWAYEAKKIAPEYIEVAVLIAWVIMEDSPQHGKDAIKILRDVGIRSSPDDWFYLEALGNAWARQSDWKQAQQQLEYALESAPSHLQSSLQQQLLSIENKQAPQIDWTSRLRSHWKLDM